MSETISFPARFNGGPGFAQGGYLAGTLSELIGGPARTTFRAPTPIETPLTIERDGDTVHLVAPDGTVTVSAEPAEIDVSVPSLPDRDTIIAARENYRPLRPGMDTFSGTPKDGCFVCSTKRKRPDGVELVSGPVRDGEAVAALWTPEGQYADDGIIKDIFLWAVLDCPSGFGAMERITSDYDMIFTGQLAAKLIAPVSASEEHVVMGWHIGSDGRKHKSGSAILDTNGNTKAVAEALWITVGDKS